LVILVANDQPMLQRVLGLAIPNLCGMPLNALVQWDRSQRRPAVVTHHFQLMRASARNSPEPLGDPKSPVARATTSHTLKRSGTTRSAPEDLTQKFHVPSSRRSLSFDRYRLSQWLSSFLSLVITVIVIGAVWRVVHPVSFNQFWRQIPFMSGTR
jgi:hypothetical protein